MNRYLFRLLLVVVLLCGSLGSRTGVKAHDNIPQKSEQKSEEQIKQHDDYLKSVAEEPQSPVEVVFRSTPSSHRVASNRPTRLLPTHGGKPGKHHGRWTTNEVYKPFNCTIPQQCRNLKRIRAVASPPRLYYIIAMRRLLC